MPRIRRVSEPGLVQHVMNRGNRRAAVFLESGDYAAFMELLETAASRFAVQLLAYCLMPNHWHLVVRPEVRGEVSAYLRWLTGTHVRRYHRVHGLEGTGHLYQGRYTSVPVQTDGHLAVVIRYVEANPVRAGLVPRAEQWPWSSLGSADTPWYRLVTDGPVVRNPEWAALVNTPSVSDTACIRQSIARGAPFGTPEWTEDTARQLGLQFTLRPPGRPRVRELTSTRP